MMDTLARLGDSAVGYAALMVLLVAMAVVALMRLIAVYKVLKWYHTHGEHAGFKYEEMHQ